MNNMVQHTGGLQGGYSSEVWWGVLAGVLSLSAVFVVPAFVGAEADGVATSTASTTGEVVSRVEVAPEPVAQVRVTVRTETGIVAQARMDLPGSQATSTPLTPTAGGDPVAVDARSALALLSALDASSSAFMITDLAYYASYGSFFLNCIDVPEHLCGYWQYTVNGAYPAIGADKYTLEPDDEVYFFFGSPRLVALSATSTSVNVPILATLTQYDPVVGAYVPTPGFTLGVVQNDPANPFVPTEVTTGVTNTLGQVAFSIATSGEYAVGIQEDFYFPTVPLVVQAGTTTPVATTTPQGGGGGALLTGGQGGDAFDVSSALAFLVSKQRADGSFGVDMYTDWAGIALGAGAGEVVARAKVRAYLAGSTSSFSSVTDYERRAMVLMALGINPYTGTGNDVIAHILESFDGTQVGDRALVNDDIFALIPLTSAGFGEDDEVLQKVVAFVLSKQKANGSWEGSIDLTAAAIQALAPLDGVSGVAEALTKAESYLRGAQKTDGGFGDSFATSWVVQAIRALGDAVDDWKRGGVSPLAFLAARQESDGGLETPETDELTRVWATAYALPAVLGKTWFDLMTAYDKPASYGGSVSRGGAVSSKNTATSTATSTVPTATTTALTTHASSTGTTSPTTATTTPPRAVRSTSTRAAPAERVVAAAPRVAPYVAPLAAVPDAVATTTSTTTPFATTTNQVATALGAAQNVKTVSRVLTAIFALLLIGFAATVLQRKRLA